MKPSSAPATSKFAQACAAEPRLDAFGRLSENRPCLNCGYDLFGIDPTAICPECGTSVERSLRGNLFQYSSRNYLRSLHLGVALILAGIAANLCLTVVGVVVAVALATNPATNPVAMNTRMTALTLIGTAITIVLLIGWWLFSSADPAIVGTDTGDGPRRTIRITLSIQAVANVVSSVLQLAGGAIAGTTGAGGVIVMVVSIVATLAWIAQFFAAMLYLRWMAPRLPNRKVYDRAKTLMWLGPLLTVLSCLVIPFIVALVLYWNMLNWVRIDLKHILGEREGEGALPTAAV